MNHIRLGNRKVTLPRSRLLRMIIGAGLVIGGVVGFLPVVGFWMIPLGLVVLSIDLPSVRRRRREAAVWLGRWMKRRYPAIWRMFEG